MIEEWRPVVGYEGVYAISNLGRVRREKAGHGAVVGRILRASIKPNGYPFVHLHNRGSKPAYVHLLVASAFLGPCPEEQEVNHLDGNKTNACVNNLEYTTHQGNVDHAVATGLTPLGERVHNAKITRQQATEIRALKGTIRSEDVGSRYGLSRQAVADIWAGRTWDEFPSPTTAAPGPAGARP